MPLVKPGTPVLDPRPAWSPALGGVGLSWDSSTSQQPLLPFDPDKTPCAIPSSGLTIAGNQSTEKRLRHWLQHVWLWAIPAVPSWRSKNLVRRPSATLHQPQRLPHLSNSGYCWAILGEKRPKSGCDSGKTGKLVLRNCRLQA